MSNATVVVCVLTAVVAMAPIAHADELCGPRRIVVVGRYAKAYRDVLARTGIRVDVVSEEELLARLPYYDGAVLARPVSALTPDENRRLKTFVAAGGGLLLDAAPAPNGFAPLLSITKSVEGWAGEVTWTADGRAVFDPRPEGRLAYRKWASGFAGADIGTARVLATFERSGTAAPYAPELANGAPAILAGRDGHGRYLLSGIHLGALAAGDPGLIRSAIGYVLGCAAESLVERAVAVPSTTSLHAVAHADGRTVAVFGDRSSPSSAMPRAVTPAFILETLQAANVAAELLDADALADASKLNAGRFCCLVLAHGEAVPLASLANIAQFLRDGGGVLSPAGVPLSKIMVRTSGHWSLAASGESASYPLFDRMLRLAKVYHATGTPVVTVKMDDAMLPHLPRVWNLKGGDIGLYPAVHAGYSSETIEKLAVSLDAAGEPVAVPLWWNPIEAETGARLLALSFSGESHPWNPRAWRFAREAILDMIGILRRRSPAVVEAVSTDHASYERGAPVAIIAKLWAPVPGTCAVHASVQDGRTGAVVWQRDTVAGLNIGESSLRLDVVQPFSPGAYDVTVTIRDRGEERTQTTMFVVREGENRPRGDDFDVRSGVLYRNRQAEWMSGVNLYFEDPRGSTVLPATGLNRHPFPAVWDRDLSWLRLVGANTVRQQYFDSLLGRRPSAAEDGEYLATLDAYHALVADRHMCADDGLLSGMTSTSVAASVERLLPSQAADLAATGLRTAIARYVERIVLRYAKFRNVIWELVNEPHFVPPRGSNADVVADWVSFIGAIVYRLTGKMPSMGQAIPSAPDAPAWNARSLDGRVAFNHLHIYEPDADVVDRPETCPSFQLAFGRPAAIGEIGMPDPTRSSRIELGDWEPFYSRVLSYVVGERALGVLNFYLRNRTGIDEPEWGLVHFDGIEKTSARAFRRWLFITRRLDAAGYRESPAFLLLDEEAYRKAPRAVLAQLHRAFHRLRDDGARLRIVADDELPMASPATVFLPDAFAGGPRLLDKARRAQARGVAFIALGTVSPAWSPVISHERTDGGREVRIVTGNVRYWSAMPKRDGGHTVVLVDGNGRVEISIAGHRFVVTLEPQFGAILDLDRQGRLLSADGAGSIARDGAVLVDAPLHARYAVASEAGGYIGGDAPVAVLAASPSSVHVAGSPRNAVTRLREISVVSPTGQYDEAIEALKRQWGALGVRVDRLEPATALPRGNVLVVGAPTESAAAAQAWRQWAPEVKIWTRGHRSIFSVADARLSDMWSGIVVDEHQEGTARLLVAGVTSVGTEAAIRRLAASTLLMSQTCAPSALLSR